MRAQRQSRRAGEVYPGTDRTGPREERYAELRFGRSGVDVEPCGRTAQGPGGCRYPACAVQGRSALRHRGSCRPNRHDLSRPGYRRAAREGGKRSTIAQELPTIAEAGIDGYAVDIWFGIVAPAATPKDIVAKLNAAIAGVLKAGELRQRLADRGYEAIGDAPEQFAATIKADIEKFGRIIRRAGIKAEL
ncbi:MAG: hypothetical protein HYU75_07920 [Betaproteobacteria bacterium]|nr:hypothetical protein [Betaproteobacteria bacterium]